MTVIDANGLIMGRLASTVAKQLLSGDDEIYIVNAEKAVISGTRATTLKDYRSYGIRALLPEAPGPHP